LPTQTEEEEMGAGVEETGKGRYWDFSKLFHEFQALKL